MSRIADNEVSGNASDENLEEAKEHLENALKSGAAAAATLGAGLVAKLSEKLEDAAENMKSEPIDFSKVKVEPLFEDMVDPYSGGGETLLTIAELLSSCKHSLRARHASHVSFELRRRLVLLCTLFH